jgi:hypothetical protein
LIIDILIRQEWLIAILPLRLKKVKNYNLKRKIEESACGG